MRRLLVALASLLVCLGAPVASAAPCADDPIVVARGHSRVTPDAGCSLAGRTVRFAGIGAGVPEPGRFVTASRTGTTARDSGRVRVATFADGHVEVDASGEAPGLGGPPSAPAAAPAAPLTDTACTDGELPGFNEEYVLASIPWSLSVVDVRGNVPPRFTNDATLGTYWTNVHLGGRFLQSGYNDCLLPEGAFVTAAPIATGTYSNNQTDFNASGSLCDGTTDGLSTVQLAPTDDALASTCTWGMLTLTKYLTTEFDIRIEEEGVYFYDDVIGDIVCCVFGYDLLGVMVHEWGHVYGMGHVPADHWYLTMAPGIGPGMTHFRTLGLGDYNRMLRQYGATPAVTPCIPSC